MDNNGDTFASVKLNQILLTLFSSNLANFGWQIWENVICKDPIIGYDFFSREKNYSDFKSGGHY